jgi:hypothetical protein
MEPSAHELLSQWEAFWVIVGSSGGGLTGLMFVVIALITESTALPRSPDSINAFGTPNVVHFVAVLFLAALLSAPWHRFKDPAHVVAAIALAGIVYVFVILRRVRKQTGYKPQLEDWVWHLMLPLAAYATLFVSAMGLSHDQTWALFTIGGVSLLLLAIGIHNAWDTVTYIASQREQK